MSTPNHDNLKALFRIKSFFDAIPLAWERASADGVSEDAAVVTLLGAMGAHGRRPPLDELMAFTMQAVPQHGLLAALAATFAATRWYKDNPQGVAAGIMAGIYAAQGADLDPRKGRGLRTQVFRLAYLLACDGAGVAERSHTVRHFRMMLGTSLAPEEDPVVAAEGRALLDEHLADLRAAVAQASRDGTGRGEIKMLRIELAQALANVAQSRQTWAERHDCDDPVARLEEALELHNEAMSFPERVADPHEPVGLYHSLRMRGSCQRLLAHHIDDPERSLKLLDGAVADARAARDLARRSPARFPDGALIVVNVVNAMKDRLAFRFEAGKVDTAQAIRELGEIWLIAREAASDRGYPLGATLIQQMQSGLDRLEAMLNGSNAAPTLDALLTHVMGAWATMSDPQADPVDPSAVRAVVTELELRPPDERLPAHVLNGLGGFFAGIHIEVVGPELAVRAMAQEQRLLSLETGEPRPLHPAQPQLWDPVDYVEQGITGFRARICNPTWAHAEKRIASGWISVLASARLTFAQRGSRPIDILEELRLADLRGSAAWRSDLAFYGTGPWTFTPGRVRTEAEWRCYLFRTRWERDHAAEFLHSVELRRLMTRLSGITIPDGAVPYADGVEIFSKGTSHAEIRARTTTPEHLWQETPDGIAVPRLLDEGAARAASTRHLAELRTAIQAMAHQGWFPREFPDLPEATPEHLRGWLSANREVAVLNVGAGLTPSLVGHDGSEIWFERFDGPDEVGRLIHEYTAARDEHSFGNGQGSAAVLDPSLSDAEREARYSQLVATPEATARLDRALNRMLASLSRAFGPALERAHARGFRRLIILPRGWARHIPWFAVPVGDSLLGETFAVACVETLAPITRAKPRTGPSVLYVGGRAGRGSSLALGKAVLTPFSDQARGPSSRDDFEAMAASAGIFRLFAHGTAMLLLTEASGIEMDEDDQRAINRFTVSEARMLDLRGARRVELWACESGRGDALYAPLVHHDEPAGMDASVLLAGAECAIASLWTQYVLSSAMIAEAFTLEQAAQPCAEADALAAAVRRYRVGMADGGCFAEAVAAYVAASPRPLRVESALRAGLDAWRRCAWSEVLGREAPALPEPVALDGLRLGPSRAASRELRGDDGALVAQILALWRSPLAWAGWRVTLRSKEVFDPPPAERPA